VNIVLRPALWHEELRKIIKEKENYARLDIGRGEKVNVEFISANPTGPLTVGNARGGFVGDVLLKKKKGYTFIASDILEDLEDINKLSAK